MSTIINTQKVIFDILKDNEPKFFAELYEEYKVIAGPVASTEMPFRRHLKLLLKQGIIKKGSDYYHRRGYLYTLADNPDPQAKGSASQVQYGIDVLEADELLKTLWNKNKHPLINKKLWDGYRLGLIKLLLSCSEGAALNQEDYREKVKQYRDLLNNHLMEINSLLNSDVWSKTKQQHILNKIGKDKASVLIEHLEHFDGDLPEWE